ncbi:hypothetical protein LUA82_04330 [Neoehrlichia mikurensis]|uniref:Uncharacterized protein n=1 Tax=Neoehrlichia mikurensis TaxID=89586 RepID=A0A9Q9BUI2_9RICK|nr:hypothetical protein [Neoehrlichia mikurensis]UTO55376.1 hypothetical protein LUA82_04330 [Neoehrlichia mikurensis]UTO56296.1 hypothetical protein LUA81_04285 [Neoehrlichia mikurensis]
MKPLSQLVYDYIFDSILFNLYLKSNSKKLYSAELDKVYSTIRSFMCKDDAENFTVSIAKKLNKPNFINSANLTAFICKGRRIAQYIAEELKNDRSQYLSVIPQISTDNLMHFYHFIYILIGSYIFSTSHNEDFVKHSEEVCNKIYKYMYKYIYKAIFHHPQEAANIASIYNIAKQLNSNKSYFNIKGLTKIYYNKLINGISDEEAFDSICRILYQRKITSIAKDAAKVANLHNITRKLNNHDYRVKDPIRISSMLNKVDFVSVDYKTLYQGKS